MKNSINYDQVMNDRPFVLDAARKLQEREERLNRARYIINGQETKETPMLTWDAAVQAMKDEGYLFRIARGCGGHNDSWASISYNEDAVQNNLSDPTAAINDLLAKCRDRWPAKHPYDDKPLEELMLICYQSGWLPIEISRCVSNRGNKWSAMLGRSRDFESGSTPADALRAAMKKREQAG